MTRPFLVTGCGRSGTTWAARALSQLGLPCLHEFQFSPVQHGPLARSESSWLAVPYLDELPTGTPVVRIMRDPYAVVRSAYARAFLSQPDANLYARFVARHRPDITRPGDHLARVIRWVALWDRPLDHHATHTLYTGDVGSLARTLGVLSGETVSALAVLDVVERLGSRVNTNDPVVKLDVPSREAIDAHPDGSLIRARARQFGFAD